jgi:hypothetical protein
MRKWLIAIVMIGASSITYAQDASGPGPSQADWNAITDARIGIVKAALQLTPEQAQYWPAVEQAVRARADARQKRLQAVAERMKQPSGSVDPIELLRGRADALAQRAATLKNLADAWAPLYPTLTPDQKQRLAFVVVRILPQLRVALDTRRMKVFDEQEEEPSADSEE